MMKSAYKKPEVLSHQPIRFETKVSGNSDSWKPGEGKPPWAGGPGGNPGRGNK